MTAPLRPSGSSFWCAAAAAALLALGWPPVMRSAEARPKGCPEGMVSVFGRFCVDRFEASTVELLGKGKKNWRPHSPYEPVEGLRVRAESKKGVTPQAYITGAQAAAACAEAGKRLCTDEEWVTACKGKRPTTFPYGKERRAGLCNDSGRSPMNHYHGAEGGGEAPLEAFSWANMNDPRLNKLAGSLARTGQFSKCRNSFGAQDMVGNLHEWTSEKGGTFRGGYYLDTSQHGDGCDYKTTAHSPKYRDYSVGFRCCK